MDDRTAGGHPNQPMNETMRSTTKRTRNVLTPLAVGAAALTVSAGAAAAQPEQAAVAADLVSPIVEHAQPGLFGSGGILDGIANIIEAVTPDSY